MIRPWLRAFLRALAACGAMWLFAACPAPESERCQKVCSREARCASRARDDRVRFDESECVETCTSLERDPAGQRLIDEHVACVEQARTCAAVRRCE